MKEFSDEELIALMKATESAIRATLQQLERLNGGTGLPKDPIAREEMGESYGRLLEGLERDARELKIQFFGRDPA